MAWRYEFNYFLVLKTKFYLDVTLSRKMLFSPLENKIYISAPSCNILFVFNTILLKFVCFSDIVHELIGHVPLFADPDFAQFSQVRLTIFSLSKTHSVFISKAASGIWWKCPPQWLCFDKHCFFLSLGDWTGLSWCSRWMGWKASYCKYLDWELDAYGIPLESVSIKDVGATKTSITVFSSSSKKKRIRYLS